jgi:hypothetical protein
MQEDRGDAGEGTALLDNAAAAKLDHKLGWIVSTFKVDEITTSTKVKGEELTYLADVKHKAQALATLLDEAHPAICRLQSFYFDRSPQAATLRAWVAEQNPAIPELPPDAAEDAPGFVQLQRGLSELSKAAEAAANFRSKVNPIRTAKGISPLDCFIFELAELYEIHFGEKPKFKWVKGQKAGSFVTFVQETARQFKVRVPAGETIAAAFRKRPTRTEMLLGI